MRKARVGRQFAETELVKFLDRRIGDWKGRKTQAQIASEAGFQSANMMSMIRTGATRLPLDRVPALAKALEADPAYLFNLTLEQQDDALARLVRDIYGLAVTDNERAWLEAIREASSHSDPTLTSKGLRAIRGVFGK